MLKNHLHLSKAQKAFNALLKKIDEKRASLAAWQDIIPAWQKEYARDFIPLAKHVIIKHRCGSRFM